MHDNFFSDKGTTVLESIEKTINNVIKQYCIDTFGIDDVEVIIGNVFYCVNCNTYTVELIEETCNCKKCNCKMIL